MGGKAKATNNQAVQFQMQQAQEARDRETARQGRLDTGKTSIEGMYDKFGKADDPNNPFYKKYTDAQLDFNMPDLERQYSKAKTQQTFNLANAGLLRSTAASDALADLAYQNAMGDASIRSNAQSETAKLGQQVEGGRQTALSQLYATEDPDVAANTATNLVNAAQLQTPVLNPLGDMFKVLAAGTAGAMGGYNDAQVLNRYGLNPKNPYQSSAKQTA